MMHYGQVPYKRR